MMGDGLSLPKGHSGRLTDLGLVQDTNVLTVSIPERFGQLVWSENTPPVQTVLPELRVQSRRWEGPYFGRTERERRKGEEFLQLE
jgi:hypothetical protein